MSCSPASGDLIMLDRYVYNLGSASVSLCAGLGKEVSEIDMMLARKVAASRATGSSAFFELSSSGVKC